MIDFKRLDHILINIPPGGKDAARKFYSEILCLKEIPGNHPRGAIWFEMGGIQLHLRKDDLPQVNSARHPAFEVENLPQSIKFLEQQNIDISYSSDIKDRDRCFFRDPFGNRFELIEYKNESA